MGEQHETPSAAAIEAAWRAGPRLVGDKEVARMLHVAYDIDFPDRDQWVAEQGARADDFDPHIPFKPDGTAKGRFVGEALPDFPVTMDFEQVEGSAPPHGEK